MTTLTTGAFILLPVSVNHHISVQADRAEFLEPRNASFGGDDQPTGRHAGRHVFTGDGDGLLELRHEPSDGNDG